MKFVLCLVLFVCIFGTNFAQYPGGFHDMTESQYNEVLPKLRTIFEHLSSTHDDFDVILRRIQSGKAQTIFGARYDVKVETVRKSNANEAGICNVDILENLQGVFDQVDVICQHNGKLFRYTKQ